MTVPATSLDQRFSDPDAAATSWADARRVLEGAQLCWITTVRADGRPHATPLVAVWLDDALHFATGRSEQNQPAVVFRVEPEKVLAFGQGSPFTHTRHRFRPSRPRSSASP